MRLNKYVFTFIILIALFVFKLAVLCWSLNKGLDITDEGAYLLWSEYYEHYRFALHYYAILLRKLVFFIEPGVINYRLLRIGTELLSLLLFAAGFWKWSRCERSLFYRSNLPLAFLFFGGALGTFLSLFSRAFSYNDFTNLNVVGAFGLILFFLGKRTDRGLSAADYFIRIGIGFFIGLQFFVKFSASLLLLSVFLLLLVFAFRAGWYAKGVAFLQIIAGILLAGLCFFLIYGQNPSAWVADFRGGLQAVALLGYSWNYYLWLYLQYDLIHFLKFFAPAFLTTLAAWGVLSVLGKGKYHFSRDGQMTVIFFSAMLAWIVTLYLLDFVAYDDLVYRKMHFSVLHSVYFYPLAIVLLSIPALSVLMKNPADKNLIAENLIIIGAVLIVPYVILLGSNTSLAKGVYAHLIPWMVLLSALIYFNFKKLNMQWFPLCLFAALIAFSQFHFIGGYLFRSYRVLGGLMDQRYAKLKNTKEALWLDEATYRFMHGIQQTLQSNGFRKDDPIIALTDMPGVVYFMEGFSPGTPWYFSGSAAVRFNCFHLR
ncbi:MAG: hypothetical protein KatS3mg031_2623 [Chitinophagales bacterium]|nr:MAG: hypothetical protein KatS3mg031_2623 [Chitinophagales bacterium]